MGIHSACGIRVNFPELLYYFLVQIIEGNSKSLNSYQLFSEKLCKIIRRSSGTKTLKFQHQILEKNKSFCLGEDKWGIGSFSSLVFPAFSLLMKLQGLAEWAILI
jgi:hypothetical protein